MAQKITWSLMAPDQTLPAVGLGSVLIRVLTSLTCYICICPSYLEFEK